MSRIPSPTCAILTSENAVRVIDIIEKRLGQHSLANQASRDELVEHQSITKRGVSFLEFESDIRADDLFTDKQYCVYSKLLGDAYMSLFHNVQRKLRLTSTSANSRAVPTSKLAKWKAISNEYGQRSFQAYNNVILRATSSDQNVADTVSVPVQPILTSCDGTILLSAHGSCLICLHLMTVASDQGDIIELKKKYKAAVLAAARLYDQAVLHTSNIDQNSLEILQSIRDDFLCRDLRSILEEINAQPSISSDIRVKSPKVSSSHSGHFDRPVVVPLECNDANTIASSIATSILTSNNDVECKGDPLDNDRSNNLSIDTKNIIYDGDDDLIAPLSKTATPVHFFHFDDDDEPVTTAEEIDIIERGRRLASKQKGLFHRSHGGARTGSIPRTISDSLSSEIHAKVFQIRKAMLLAEPILLETLSSASRILSALDHIFRLYIRGNAMPGSLIGSQMIALKDGNRLDMNAFLLQGPYISASGFFRFMQDFGVAYPPLDSIGEMHLNPEQQLERSSAAVMYADLIPIFIESSRSVCPLLTLRKFAKIYDDMKKVSLDRRETDPWISTVDWLVTVSTCNGDRPPFTSEIPAGLNFMQFVDCLGKCGVLAYSDERFNDLMPTHVDKVTHFLTGNLGLTEVRKWKGFAQRRATQIQGILRK